MSWTDDRVELLKKLWLDGQSASQVAKELGGVTRNAVIGKVHRLGMSNRATNTNQAKSEPKEKSDATPKAKAKAEAKPKSGPKTEPARPAAGREAKPVIPARRQIIPAGQPLPPQPSANEISPEALAKVNEIEKNAKKLNLMELTEKTCKWPVGDPATEDFWFCGLPVEAGKPYCEAHVGVAFQPMNSRRDRRR